MTIHSFWTEQRVARLKELWAKGWSSSQVAADLGGFSDCGDNGRSAVIGKIHRLKLPQPETKLNASGRNNSPRAPSPPRPFLAPPPAPRLRNGHDPAQRRNPSHNIEAAIAIAGTEPGIPERLKGERPDGTGIKLIDLDASKCHWPRGDPLEDNFEFCGGKALTDRPYCAGHTRLAYLPSSRAARGV